MPASATPWLRSIGGGSVAAQWLAHHMIVALINPSACRSHGAEIAHALAGSSPRMRLVISDSEDDVDSLIATMATQRTELLVVAGGDGTLLNLLTRFHAAGRLAAIPPLLVLPAGDINTTAKALVGQRRPEVLGPRILHAWTRGVRRLHRMPVLRLAIDGQPDRVGVSISLGAVARTHRDYEESVRKGAPAVAELLMKLALQQLAGERFRRIPGPFELDDGFLELESISAGIVSPLPGFFVGIRPFPGVRTVSRDGFHATFSDLGAYATQASMIALVRGHMPAGARVHHGLHHRLAWMSDESEDVVAIDGEMVIVPPRTRVLIEQTGHVRIVVWRAMPVTRPADDVGDSF